METLRMLEDETSRNIFDELEACIDDMGEGMDETTLNDFLWFEDETIADWLGFSSWEELERVANGEDEEDEEDEEDDEEEELYAEDDVVKHVKSIEAEITRVTRMMKTLEENEDDDEEDIELEYAEGDVVELVNGIEAKIIRVDEDDRELPYFVTFENENGETMEEWEAADEIDHKIN